MSESNFVFFWGGVFSQWYPHLMKIDGIEYNCAEQYMMAMKASHFGDRDSLTLIMNSKESREQKAYGRLVKNFDPVEWNKVCRDIVYKGNLHKFSTEPLKSFLINTGDRELVEASPTDVIWGIGLHKTDPRCLDKSQWRGTNWLGECLMRVRTTLINIDNGYL